MRYPRRVSSKQMTGSRLAVQPDGRVGRAAGLCPPDGSGLKRSAGTDMVVVEIAIVLRLGQSEISSRRTGNGFRSYPDRGDLSIKIRGREMMRRISTCLAVLGLAALGLSASASAAPTITLKAEAVPIPGFPHTGNILGAGAALKAEYTISGTEYGGFPPPLIGVKFYGPASAKLHTQGFGTCAPEVIEKSGPGPCPKKSQAGP